MTFYQLNSKIIPGIKLDPLRVSFFAEIGGSAALEHENSQAQLGVVDPRVQQLGSDLVAAVLPVHDREDRGLEIDDAQRVLLLRTEVNIVLPRVGTSVTVL